MDNTYTGLERRNAPRVKIDFFVSYKVCPHGPLC